MAAVDYPRTIPARFGLIWFSGFRGKDLNVIFYQYMPNLHNWYKSAARKISHLFSLPFNATFLYVSFMACHVPVEYKELYNLSFDS
jgi:hypothetical protein